MLRRFLLAALCFIGPALAAGQAAVFEVKSGRLEFHSTAPKELISAASGKVRGIVDLTRHTFAFKVDMASFMGFNSPLQREHFNENYMETSQFPEATFTGKIIEEPDLGKDGMYLVRAKGRLNIHGLMQERIIKANVLVRNGQMTLDADFTVALADHNIKIPRIVYDKLAPEINVNIHAVLTLRR